MKLFFFTFSHLNLLALPQIIRRPLALTCAMLLAACSTYNDTTQRIAQHITPYQITVVQGNFISREAVTKLQVGMSQEHVRAMLGTPLLIDIFHPNQWDYIFYFKRGATEVVQRRHLVVYFERDQLSRWTGGEDLPSENELLAEIDGDRRANTRRKQSASARSPSAESQ